LKTLFLIPFALLPFYAYALEPDQIIEGFFDNLDAGSYSRAIDYFFTGNKRMQGEQLQAMKTQLSNHLGAIGSFHEYNLIKHDKHTQYFHTYTFLIRYEQELVFAQLHFYKPRNRWVGYNLLIHGDENKISEYFYLQKLAKP